MKLRMKLALLVLSATTFAMMFGNCGRFLGDMLGDALWLRGID